MHLSRGGKGKEKTGKSWCGERSDKPRAKGKRLERSSCKALKAAARKDEEKAPAAGAPASPSLTFSPVCTEQGMLPSCFKIWKFYRNLVLKTFMLK